MAINTKSEVRPYSQVHIANQSFDAELQTSVVQPLGFDGQALQRTVADSIARKITEVGPVTYIAIAKPGTAQGTAKWQVQKLDDSTGVTTWADGDADFNNVATDLTALTYS